MSNHAPIPENYVLAENDDIITPDFRYSLRNSVTSWVSWPRETGKQVSDCLGCNDQFIYIKPKPQMNTPQDPQQIHLTSESQAFAVFTYLKEQGFKFDLEKGSDIKELASIYLCNYPNILIFPRAKKVSGNFNAQPMYQIITLDQLFDGRFEKPTSIMVKLNDKYNAVVSATSVVVGCQTFPLSVIDELVEARDTIKQG